MRWAWILLLIPSASALGIELDGQAEVIVDPELPVPALPNPHVSVGLGSCPLCQDDEGLFAEPAPASIEVPAGAATTSPSAAEHASYAWTWAFPLAALAGLLTKLYWSGPGRVLGWLGPMKWLGVALTAWAWPTDLENETRQKIHQYIQKRPGASIQEARRHAGVAWGTTVYHLHRMERDGTLISAKVGNRHRYWIAGSPEAGVRTAWALLEQPTTRAIADAVSARPGIHQGGLCADLGLANPTASKHLKRLVTHGLVKTRKISRYTCYGPTEKLDQVLQLRQAA